MLDIFSLEVDTLSPAEQPADFIEKLAEVGILTPKDYARLPQSPAILE
jgi:hypothetical protein